MQLTRKASVVVLVLTGFLAACDDDTDSSTSQNLTGQLVDAAIEGATIKRGNSAAQTTNSDGEFTYKLGDTCEVVLGERSIYNGDCKNHIGLTDLVPTVGKTCDSNDHMLFDCNSHINLARLLQTVDKNPDPKKISWPTLDEEAKAWLKSIDFDKTHEAFANDATVQALITRLTGAPTMVSAGKAYAHVHSLKGSESLKARRFVDKKLVQNRRYYMMTRTATGTVKTSTMDFMADRSVLKSDGLTDLSEELKNYKRMEWRVDKDGQLLLGELRAPMKVVVRKRLGAADYRIGLVLPDDTTMAQMRTKGIMSTDIEMIRAADGNVEPDLITEPFTDPGINASPYLYSLQQYKTSATAAGQIYNLLAETLGLSENDWYIAYFALGNQNEPNLGTQASDCPSLDNLEVDSTDSTVQFGFITYSSENDSYSCYSNGRDVLVDAILNNCEKIIAKTKLPGTSCDAQGSPFEYAFFRAAVISAVSNADQSYSVEDNGELLLSDAAHIAGNNSINLFTYVTRFAETVEVESAAGNLICIDPENDVSSLTQCSDTDGTEAILFSDSLPVAEGNETPGFNAAATLANACTNLFQMCTLPTF